MNLSQFPEKLARFIIANPIKTIFLCFIVAVIVSSGVRYLQFSTNYRVFFSGENPQLQAFNDIERIYNKTDNVFFTIKPDSGNVFDVNTLNFIQELTAESWKLPFTQRVDSITNYQYSRAEEDDLTVSDLVEEEPASLSFEQLNAAKMVATSEPLLVNKLITPQADATGVNVTMNLPRKHVNEVTIAAAAARELVDEFRSKYPNIKIVPSGMVFMNNAFSESAMNDLSTLVPIMYLVLTVVMFLLLKSVSATFATLVVIMFSASAAMGFGGWVGFPLTPPSAITPTIVLTLAIADSIHIIVSMFKAMHKGMEKKDAIVESMRINFQPIMLTSVTTILGFLTFNFSEAPPFWHLGNMTAFGIGAAFIFSVTLLPAMLSLLPIRAKAVSTGKYQAMDHVADFVINNRKILLIGSVIVSIFLGFMATKIELNDQFVQYFDDSIEFRTDTEYMMNNLSGIYTMEYSLKGDEPSGISKPEYLRALDDYSKWLLQQPEVEHVYSVGEIFKRLNKNMHGDDPQYYRIPENAEMGAQYLLLYEFSLPYGLDLTDRINIDKSSTRMTVTLKDMPTKDIRAFKTRSEKWLKDNAPPYMYADATSPIVMFAFISQRNIDSMIEGNLILLVCISLLIMVALKSIKIGLISLVPNLIPIALGFGLWGLFIGTINMAVAISAAVSIGIIVDDTVHFLSKYVRARREKAMDSSEAVRYAFNTVGTALVVTTIILMLGFYVLTLSGFQMNSFLGLLTIMVIGSALAADFLLLPPLLILLEKKNMKPSEKIEGITT